MAFGIAGDEELADAVVLEDAALDQLLAAVQFARRPVAVAAQGQHPVDARLVPQAAERAIHIPQAGEVARGEVRHGDQAPFAQLGGGGDHPVDALAGDGGDEHLGAPGQELGRRFDRLAVASDHFRRIALQQATQGFAGGEGRQRPHGQISSRFLEMMKDSSLNQSPPCLRSTSLVAFR